MYVLCHSFMMSLNKHDPSDSNIPWLILYPWLPGIPQCNRRFNDPIRPTHTKFHSGPWNSLAKARREPKGTAPALPRAVVVPSPNRFINTLKISSQNIPNKRHFSASCLCISKTFCQNTRCPFMTHTKHDLESFFWLAFFFTLMHPSTEPNQPYKVPCKLINLTF